LDNPALGQHMKAARDGRRFLPRCYPDAFETRPPMLDDLHIPLGQLLCCPRAEPTVVVAVGPQLPNARKPLGQALQEQYGTVTVGHVGRMYLRCQHQALSVHHQVAFTTLDLFAAIVAALWSTNTSRFDTLTIDDRRTRLHLATECLPEHLWQNRM